MAYDQQLADALKEIERLRAELKEFHELKEYAKSHLELHSANERLRAALKPFAEIAETYEDKNYDFTIDIMVTGAELKAARKAFMSSK